MKKKLKRLNDGDPWMLAENIPDADIFFFQIPLTTFTSDKSFPFIKKYSKSLSVYKGFHMDFYFGKQNSYEVGESIAKALEDRSGFGKEVNTEIVRWSTYLLKFAKGVALKDMSKLSNEGLWKIYKEHDRIHTKLYTYGWLPVSVDMFHNNFTKRLKSYLYSVCKDKNEAEAAFQVLVTPSTKTIIAKEREDFLAIYKKHFNDLEEKNISLSLNQTLEIHSKKWGHQGYIYAGNAEVFGVIHYFNEMKDLRKSGISAKSILQKEKLQLSTASRKKFLLIKKLKINTKYKRLFNTAIDFGLTKLIRRDAQLQDLLILHHTLLPEIAKRLSVSRRDVQFMLQDEVKDALLQNRIDRKVLKIRFKSCVLYAEEGFEKVYTGKDSIEFTKNIKSEIDKDQKEFSGQTAQPGYAKGIVKIIIRAKDMAKMNAGDILVSIATDPDVVLAMKKAAAIVTDQGGITSHAAIVSRELGVPCIIGTKIATKVLKDGELVEVDAHKGIVRILK